MEGQITRLKLLKRQMFGRASLALLERRFVLRAWTSAGAGATPAGAVGGDRPSQRPHSDTRRNGHRGPPTPGVTEARRSVGVVWAAPHRVSCQLPTIFILEALGVCWALEPSSNPKSNLMTQESGMRSPADDTNWAVSEFADAELGDVRRTTRLIELAGVLAQHPTAALPEACGDDAMLKAAYRFFANDAIEPHDVLDSHIEATYRRLHHVPVVLAVQDTTEVDWTSHPATRGLGPLGPTSLSGSARP